MKRSPCCQQARSAHKEQTRGRGRQAEASESQSELRGRPTPWARAHVGHAAEHRTAEGAAQLRDAVEHLRPPPTIAAITTPATAPASDTRISRKPAGAEG
jgi:hypothetical protein